MLTFVLHVQIMVSSKLKTDISRVLEKINDERFLSSILAMMEAYDRTTIQLSPEQLKELELRIADHQAGRTENIPWKQSLDEVRSSLKSFQVLSRHQLLEVRPRGIFQHYKA